jgi:tRNA A37 N6-isopentenylltransferase MiaA
MVKDKGDRDIVDRRLEETLDLFQPTAQQATAAEEAKAPKRTPKPRDFERDNPAFAFRIRPEDNERIAELAEVLEVTKDALGAGLMRAALDAVDAGRLVLDVEREPMASRDKLGRLRSFVAFTVRGRWVNPAE